jgi:hypothetical protein
VELDLHSPYKPSWSGQRQFYIYLSRIVFTARYGLNFYTQCRLKLVFAQLPACLYQKDEQAMPVNLQQSKGRFTHSMPFPDHAVPISV